MLAFNYGGDKDHFVDLFIDNDQSVPDHYLGTVAVCNNPICDCNSLTMYMHHANKSEETLKLICDLNEHKITECSDESVQHISLVKIINTKFSDKEWDEISLVYRNSKAQYSEDIENLRSFEFDFSNYSPGSLVPYAEVLPLSAPIVLKAELPYIMGYDQYCPNPKCDCASVTLDAAFLNDNNKFIINESNSLAITLSFKTRKIKEIHGKCKNTDILNPEEILKLINSQEDDIWNRLENRYRNIRAIYAQYLKREKKVETIKSTGKIRRNESCPCGSGKKYKKCCLLAAQ